MAHPPVLDAVVAEAAHGFDDRVGRMLEVCIRRYRDQERLLVLRAAPRFAAITLPAQVGVIDLHETGQLAWRFVRRHRLHHLVPWGLPLVVLVAVNRWMASSQARSDSLVASRIVPLSRVV